MNIGEKMREIKLKSCPFCGQDSGKVLLSAEKDSIEIFVHCESCGARGEAIGVFIENGRNRPAKDIVDELEVNCDEARDSWNYRKLEA